MAITLQTIESLPLIEEVNENTSLVGWDGEKTVRVAASDMVGGPGLPEGGEPHKQLVTDSEGKVVWEDRLAWAKGDKIEIFWDGNTEGLTRVAGEYWQMYKVSSLILTDEQIKAMVFKSHTGTKFDPSTMATYWDVDGVVYNECITFVRKENVTFNGVLWEEPGVYVVRLGNDWIEEIVSVIETVNTIPEKYLPTLSVCFKNDGEVDGTRQYGSCTATYKQFYDAFYSGKLGGIGLLKDGNEWFNLSNPESGVTFGLRQLPNGFHFYSFAVPMSNGRILLFERDVVLFEWE